MPRNRVHRSSIPREYIRVPFQLYNENIEQGKIEEYVKELLREKGLKIQHCVENVGCFNNYRIRIGRRYIIVDYYEENIKIRFYLVPVHGDDVIKLRKQYREEMIDFLKKNGFECKYRKQKWLCEHPNNYYVTINNKGITFEWGYENSVPRIRYVYNADESHREPLVEKIIDGTDLGEGGGIVNMEYKWFIPWDMLYENREEFENEIRELKKLISRIKDYRIWFAVDIIVHIEKRRG